MFIYIIRWKNRVNNEEETGFFKMCYTNEIDARRAMLVGKEKTKQSWEKAYGKERIQDHMPGDSEPTYCGFYVQNHSYDYHEWYIDKLTVYNVAN
jgi:hypothetical protein